MQNCIQIIPLNINKNHKKYKFTLRDPNRYEPIDKNKYIFYFGKISFNLLTLIRNHNNELISEVLSPFTDIGIKSQSQNVTFKSFDFGKKINDFLKLKFQILIIEPEINCKDIISYSTCIKTLTAPNNDTYLIIMHPFPSVFSTIQEKIGLYDEYETYENETIDGLVYKVYKFDTYLRITVCYLNNFFVSKSYILN